jgi:hypothetical protein
VFDLLNQDRKEEAMQLFSGQALSEFEVYLETLNDIVRRSAGEALARGERILTFCNGLLILQAVLLG